MGDPRAALALTDPGAPERIAIAVPDGTRCLDTPAGLRALAQRFRGVRGAVVVGLGLHRPMRDRELAPLRAACDWPVINHDPDRCVDLGVAAGHPVWVHPALADADLVIGLGVVELHQYAGFSGGHKAAAVGCGGRATLSSLHARALVCHPAVQVGRLVGNPFRAAVDAIGQRAGCRLALQGLPDGRWVAGDPVAALAAAAATLRPWRDEPRLYATALLRVPPTKAVNFYQASRAATYLALSPAPPLVDGALLVLDAACPEGAGTGDGERAFSALMASTAPPWGALLEGPVPSGAGLQRAYMIARLARRYRLIVAGCRSVDALRALGVRATAAPAESIAGPDALHVPSAFTRLPQWRPDPAGAPG